MRCWIHLPTSALLSVLLVLQPLLPSVASAAAPTAQDRKASRLAFGRAQEAYEAGRFEEALTGYREANERMSNPAFIFNMAQCYRQLGAHDEALAHYQRYLDASPTAKNRTVVEAHIQDLQTAIAQRPPPKPVLTPSDELMLQQQEQQRREEEAAALAAAPAATPIYQTWWFWTAAAVVAGGVATGVVLSQGGDSLPPASLGDVSIR